LVTGDFNIDLLKVHHHFHTTAFYNIMVAHGLTPSITKPNRITEFSNSLIDNIFINTMKYTCKATIFCSDISDHYPVMLELADMKEFLPCPDYKHRIYDTPSIEKFTESLQNIDWSEFNERCNREIDTDILYQDFIKIFMYIYDESFPIKI